jgi:alanine-synthesizing transaminase
MFAQRTNWPLARNRYTDALEERRRAGRELLDLTASNPTAVGFEYDPRLLQAFANPEAMNYRPDAKGMRSAREAVSGYYQARGEPVSPDNIILTTSTSEAYSFVFRLLCDPGDEVLIPAPGYPLFEFLADLQDVRLKPYGLFYDHGWHVDLHAARTAVAERTRAILAVHPNNPTGSYLHAPETADLNALCGERELALVVDEVFLDFAHDAHARAASFATNDAALTFTLSGVSKIAGLPQMKFAWIVVSGPAELATTALERLEVIADTYLSMNAPVQLAAPAMFDAREKFQSQLMARVRKNLGDMDSQLARHPLCERLKIEGGWYAVLRVPATRSDEDLAIELLREGVLVHPGHFYDFSSDGFLVLSLLTPEDEFRDGVARLISFFAP